MGNLVLTGNVNLPAHIADRQKAYSGSAMTVSEFTARNRISLKGNMFTASIGGETKKLGDKIDVVIVGAIPGVQRTFYKGKFDPNVTTGPDCWSSDGKNADANVGAPVSPRCDICPNNEKGSARDGDGRACRFLKRMVVIIDGDDSLTQFSLDVNATSIFGEDKPSRQLYSSKSFGEMLDNRQLDPRLLVTHLSFDTDSGSPSKLFFTPVRFLEADELEYIDTNLDNNTLEKMLVLNDAPAPKKGAMSKKDDDTPIQPAAAAKTGGFGKKTKAAEPAPEPDDVEEAKPTPAPKKTGFGKAKAAVVADDDDGEAAPAKSAKVVNVSKGNVDAALAALEADDD